MKGKSALTLLLAGIFSCGTCQATGAEVTSESVFNILNSTGAATDKSYLSLNPDKYPNYRLLIHSAKLQNEIKSHYTKDERIANINRKHTKVNVDGETLGNVYSCFYFRR
ncbi:hypothetical protein G998_02847 [Escherichia coli UMEA 3889-1]|nr:hypothetical protein G998_02847 [Escherichia coli UMEA 3889-1]